MTIKAELQKYGPNVGPLTWSDNGQDLPSRFKQFLEKKHFRQEKVETTIEAERHKIQKETLNGTLGAKQAQHELADLRSIRRHGGDMVKANGGFITPDQKHKLLAELGRVGPGPGPTPPGHPPHGHGGSGGITPGTGVKQQLNVRYGPGAHATYDVYKPQHVTQNTPVVYMIHGGAWNSGEKEDRSAEALKLAQQGLIVVNINYKLLGQDAPNMNVLMTSAANAVASAQRKLGGHHPGFLMGHSAGGQIAALLATDPHYLRQAGATQKINGVIGFSGVYDVGAGSGQYSPQNHDDKNDPPTLLFSGQNDATWGLSSGVYAQDIRNAGGVVRAEVVPHTNHNSVISRGIDHNYDNILNKVLHFIQANS